MKNKRLRLLCVIPTLGHGGAQKILVDLAHYFSDNHNSIESTSFLTFADSHCDFHTLNDNIEREYLSTVRGSSISFSSIFATTWRLRQILKTNPPDIILSFQDIANYAVILGSIGLNIRLIVSERQDTNYYSMPRTRRFIRNLLYRHCSHIVVQTSAIAKQFPANLQSKITVIPNHVSAQSRQATPSEPGEDGFFRAIAAGRLVDQKNFELIINAATHLKDRQEKWKIEIYGAGRLLDTLNNLIKANGVEHLVEIHEPTTDLIGKMNRAQLFLFPSKYEGFPNVLAEAVSSGLPAIAFKEVSGNSDLIENKFNGLLLSEKERNPQDFARAMSFLMNSSAQRNQMGENCRTIIPRYRKEILFNKWSSLLT